MILVLQQEEDQERHHEEVHADGNQVADLREREGQHALRRRHGLVAQPHDEILDLHRVDQIRAALGQLEQQLLHQTDHSGQRPHHLFELLQQQREEREQREEQEGQEAGEHDAERHRPRHPDLAQARHRPVQHVRDDDTRDHRREHAAEKDDEQDPAEQQREQCDDLGIPEVAAEPVADRVHLSAPAPAPAAASGSCLPLSASIRRGPRGRSGPECTDRRGLAGTRSRSGPPCVPGSHLLLSRSY